MDGVTKINPIQFARNEDYKPDHDLNIPIARWYSLGIDPAGAAPFRRDAIRLPTRIPDGPKS